MLVVLVVFPVRLEQQESAERLVPVVPVVLQVHLVNVVPPVDVVFLEPMVLLDQRVKIESFSFFF